MIESKICTQCGECKPLSAFAKDGTHVGGYRSGCKQCKNDRYLASRAGLPKSWRASEDAVVVEFYPQGGAEMCFYLLGGRSRTAINRRAKKLNVSWAGAPQVDPADKDWGLADFAPAHRAWQQIDRRIAAIPAANGPSFSMGAIAA